MTEEGDRVLIDVDIGDDRRRVYSYVELLLVDDDLSVIGRERNGLMKTICLHYLFETGISTNIYYYFYSYAAYKGIDAAAFRLSSVVEYKVKKFNQKFKDKRKIVLLDESLFSKVKEAIKLRR